MKLENGNTIVALVGMVKFPSLTILRYNDLISKDHARYTLETCGIRTMYTAMDLYELSDEEIKVSDYFMDFFTDGTPGKVRLCKEIRENGDVVDTINSFYEGQKTVKKIVRTTNGVFGLDGISIEIMKEFCMTQSWKGEERPAHERRVIDEKTELDEKIAKLSKFIEENSLYESLTTIDKSLLRNQLYHMTEYSNTLYKRIRRFPVD